MGTAWNLLESPQDSSQGSRMSYDILKNLGLDHLDASSPDFLAALERMQKEAWLSLQQADAGNDDVEVIVR
jgi:hypothetical protein